MRFFIVFFIMVWIAACSPKESDQLVINNNKADIFMFMEQEQGIDPYPVRMTVTSSFLRMDEGNAEDDFLLFDRKNEIVYSITHETKSYYQFESTKKSPVNVEKPELTKTNNDVSEMPFFDDKKPIHISYFADAQRCFDVISVPELYRDSVDAMREYLQVMSLQHAATVDRTPKELQEKCMLANFIFAPVQHLDNGFPLREWDYRGYSRNLVDYKSESVDSNLFRVPETYERTQL